MNSSELLSKLSPLESEIYSFICSEINLSRRHSFNNNIEIHLNRTASVDLEDLLGKTYKKSDLYNRVVIYRSASDNLVTIIIDAPELNNNFFKTGISRTIKVRLED